MRAASVLALALLSSGCLAIDDFGSFTFEGETDAGDRDSGPPETDGGADAGRDGGPGVETDCDDGDDDDRDGDVDCDDSDCDASPACVLDEDCANETDDDGDDLVDCGDPDCDGDPLCAPPENCTNGSDDDGDGATDCADADCAAAPACTPEDCDNGADDDADGNTDCADSQCATDPACVPPEDCTNGVDDDMDGATDCADAECAAMMACIESCTNGMDDDGDGFIDCVDPSCSGSMACAGVENCMNARDDDGDMLVDCADVDCNGSPACTVGGGAATSAQIAAVRMSADGVIDLPIDNAIVTYRKPALGSDPAGFFVQAEASGPALFVRIDPLSLSPPAEVGQVVSFRAGDVSGFPRTVSLLSGWAVASSGHSTDFLVQDVSAVPDLVSNLDAYESELVRGRFRLTSTFTAAGAGFVAASADTDVVMGASLRVRVPSSLMPASVPGCVATLSPAPLWRFLAEAQPSASYPGEIAISGCPPPRVVSATSASATEVWVVLDRDVDATSIDPSGSQFTFMGGILPTGITSVVARRIIVRTTAQTAGAPYAVSVASTVRDTLGIGVDPMANSASFTGFMPIERLVINEIDYDNPGTDTAEFIELYNNSASPVDLSRIAVVLVNGTGQIEYNRVSLSGMLAAFSYAVVASPTVPVDASALRFTLAMSPQNGSPDAVAIIDMTSGMLLDALAYEDPAATMMSATIGGIPGYDLVEGNPTLVADDNIMSTTLVRLPNGADTNDAATDWAASLTATPGAANVP